MIAPSPDWLAARRLGAARALRRATSATGLARHRAGFGWTVVPAPGSILASTRTASWDPEPDYFHHWIRDAAIALRAVPAAIAADPEARGFWTRAVADHIRFSLAISDPDRAGPATNPLAATATPEFRKFLRPDAELAALGGSAWLEEPRCAPDGGPDLEQWGRPQDDGPALRASALMGLLDEMPELAGDGTGTEALIARDLAHVTAVAGRPCIGPWEESPPRRTTFTLIVEWDALTRGAARSSGADAAAMLAAADRVAGLIDEAEDRATGVWRESIEAPAGHLDSATILAVLHADRRDGRFALDAPQTRATAAALEAIFATLYPLNAGRAAPAMGRWREDVYFGGNPWLPVTLGFAELSYRIAAQRQDPAAFAKAEDWMAWVEAVAPEGDDLPEQIDRKTGAPAACLALTWSAAAFLGAATARDAAVQALASPR
ncbi:glycoside hydrolase family 15 protein [Tropicimonas sp. IMCC34043]|uniref:glycoside hydrolase family 15 protein n=1 Tax=Tropicimonas sp. IMCC34043 TaxID=2248760 RepID=UPI001300A4FF|nr:glycoside hydrolase family 15 protein [Tropicimonas sp. IMCC34043]